MPSEHKHIFVRVMSAGLIPQVICLRFPLPPPTEPAIKCEIYQVGVDQPSFEAFRKWENNRNLIQCRDWEHRTAAPIGWSQNLTLGRAVYAPTALQYCAAFRSTIPMPIGSKKVFAGALSPENSPEARKSQATFVSTFYPSAECGQTHFCSRDVNRVENPLYPSTVSTPPKWTCHKVWNIVRKSCSTFSWGIKDMREQLRLGSSHWLGRCRSKTGGPVSKAMYRMGSECTKKNEKRTRPFSPHLMPMLTAHKHVFVSVTWTVLERLLYLAALPKWAFHKVCNE